MNFIEGS